MVYYICSEIVRIYYYFLFQREFRQNMYFSYILNKWLKTNLIVTFVIPLRFLTIPLNNYHGFTFS